MGNVHVRPLCLVFDMLYLAHKGKGRQSHPISLSAPAPPFSLLLLARMIGLLKSSQADQSKNLARFRFQIEISDFRFRFQIQNSDNWLTDWMTDWLNDRLTDWLIDWLTDWLADWLTHERTPTDEPTNWLTKWLTVFVTCCLSQTRQTYGERAC